MFRHGDSSHTGCLSHSHANAERQLSPCNTLVNAEWNVVLYAGWLSVTVSQMSPKRDLPLALAWSRALEYGESPTFRLNRAGFTCPKEVTMGNAVSLWSTSRAPAADSADSGERRAAASMAAGTHVVAARLRLTSVTRSPLTARCIFPCSRYI